MWEKEEEINIIKGPFWLTDDGMRPYREADAADVYKWILVERSGERYLAAMPSGEGMDFHIELASVFFGAMGWCDDCTALRNTKGNDFPEMSLRVLGGGTRFPDGRVIHRSVRFGEMPERFKAKTLHLLMLDR